jgi:UDP-N-acetylmuramoylalanine--D-glutamate ligase
MRLVVLGGGESGVGTAILVRRKDMLFLYLILEKLKINTRKPIDNMGRRRTYRRFNSATVVMKSPGIPDKASIVKKLVEKELR